MDNLFMEKIHKAEYYDAEKVFLQIEADNREKYLLNVGYKFESISIIGFLLYLKEKGWGKKDIYKWLSILLMNPLCFIEGSYSLAAFFVKELVKLDPIVENMELVIFLYETPENVISNEYLKEIVEKILSKDPTNKVAKKYWNNDLDEFVISP